MNRRFSFNPVFTFWLLDLNIGWKMKLWAEKYPRYRQICCFSKVNLNQTIHCARCQQVNFIILINVCQHIWIWCYEIENHISFKLWIPKVYCWTFFPQESNLFSFWWIIATYWYNRHEMAILQGVVDQHFYKILSLNIALILGNSADPDECRLAIWMKSVNSKLSVNWTLRSRRVGVHTVCCRCFKITSADHNISDDRYWKCCEDKICKLLSLYCMIHEKWQCFTIKQDQCINVNRRHGLT